MGHQNQGLSRTLPKNFTFPSMAARDPQTPERASTDLDVPPPPPRHSSARVRRSRVRSGTDVFAQAEYDHTTFNDRLSDVPLPSIEFPPAHDAPKLEQSSAMPANDRYLAPPRDQPDMKTPPAQIRATPMDSNPTGAWSRWEYQRAGTTIERPGSVCSNASDSSVSSLETFASRPSIGGSCTSMESELQDPFMNLETPPKKKAEPQPAPSKPRQLTEERWTLEMDAHLWNTYQLYLQDPTITPFKMTPGSIPPLGVTHRVAREAKKSWGKRGLGARLFSKVKPLSRKATPTGKPRSSKTSWSRSETSTRRRLKLLCKRRFSIPPHYQRMIQSRSPTPFLETFSRSRESSQVNASGSDSYATRDLGVSLVSATASGPLSQFAAEENSQSSSAGNSFGRPLHQTDWIASLKADQIDPNDCNLAPRLGSPFKFRTWGPSSSKGKAPVNDTTARRGTVHVPEYRQRMPARLDPLPNLFRGSSAQLDPLPNLLHSSSSQQLETEESSPIAEDTQHHLENLFNQGKVGENGGRVRIRSRGATTSAVSSRRLDQLFSPPSSQSSMQYENTPAKPANPLLDIGEESKRLGSPFKVDGLSRPGFPSKFEKHAPSLSDPFVNGAPQFSGREMKSSRPSDAVEEKHF